MLCETMGMEYDFEDTKVKEDNDFIEGVLQDINDYMDYLGMQVELGPKISVINYLNELLGNIEKRGFVLFGENRKKKMKFGDGSSESWRIVVLCLMKNNNSNIINFPTDAK